MLVEREVVRVTSVEARTLLARPATVRAVFVAHELLSELPEIDVGIAVIAVVSDLTVVTGIPPWVHEVMVEGVTDIEATMRLEFAFARARHLWSQPNCDAIMSKMPLALVVVGRDGSLPFHSQRFRAMWNLDRAISHKSQLPTSCQTLLVEEMNDREYEVATLDGHIVRIFSTAVRVADEQTGTLFQLEDLTERREMLAALRRSEAMSAMGALVGGVAHDVRNRLFGISATLDAFEANIPEATELKPFFGVLRDELSRLGSQLSELLDYGRAGTLQLAPAELRNAIADAVVLTHDLADRTSTHVEIQIARSLPSMMFDQRRMVQVFQNVLSNAIQHAAGGRVILSIEIDDSQTVTCKVRDSGSGFLPAEIDRVFEPFFTRRHGGVGLGLAIAARVVTAHGGKIKASNHAGGGGEIVIELPLREARSLEERDQRRHDRIRGR